MNLALVPTDTNPANNCDETRKQIWHEEEKPRIEEERMETSTQCLAKHEPRYGDDATKGDENPIDKSV